MGLESATFISQLVSSNPGGADAYSTADDHLRLIKAVLQAQFPNLGAAAVTPTAAELNVLAGSSGAVERQANKNAASGYAGVDASGRIVKAQGHVLTAYTDSANVFTADQRISNSQPNWYFKETDAGADATLWRLVMSAGVFMLMTGNDAEGSFTAFMSVTRTGAAPNVINFAGTALQFNGVNLMTTATAVTNAQVPQSSVTQHQAALSIGYGQLTGVPSTFAPSAHTHAATDVTSGTFVDARIAATNVTQHQAALSIATSQLTGTLADARVAATNVTQHQAALSIAATQLTGTIADARVAVTNVTQHQASLSIATSQLTGTLADARLVSSNVTQFNSSIIGRNISGKTGIVKTLSSAAPSGGADGDIWYQY